MRVISAKAHGKHAAGDMNFHLDHQLRLKSVDEIDHTGLYQWAIVEVDGGRQVGTDQIPWRWTLNFKGTELAVSDGLGFDGVDFKGNDREVTATHRHRIRVKLRPGGMGDDDDWTDEPSYSFFGTDRTITDFQLEVLPVAADQKEGCSSWGSVSYTTEADFRDDTTTDTVQFYLMVSQAMFDRYIWNIAQGLADEIYLAVGNVAGFYSDWSPSITTTDIKVLAGTEHVVAGASDIDLPRLGKIGNTEFYMIARRQLERAAPPSTDEGGRGASIRWPRRRK